MSSLCAVSWCVLHWDLNLDTFQAFNCHMCYCLRYWIMQTSTFTPVFLLSNVLDDNIYLIWLNSLVQTHKLNCKVGLKHCRKSIYWSEAGDYHIAFSWSMMNASLLCSWGQVKTFCKSGWVIPTGRLAVSQNKKGKILRLEDQQGWNHVARSQGFDRWYWDTAKFTQEGRYQWFL